MPKSRPWFESLTDSVLALGAAARETRAAARAAELADAAYDVDRLRPVDGELHLDSHPTGSVPFRPHDAALFAIGDAHMKHAFTMQRLYANAALGYAYGTAWAILRVLEGERPPAVWLGRSDEGAYYVPGELCPVPPLVPQLERWCDYPKLVAARDRWAHCEQAGLFAECLDEQPHISDHDAGQLHVALDTAAGSPDAAYTYGELAESGLRFALPTARTNA
ncbi:hypothetical protein [Streptomyces sp. NPDC055105]|uniref:hypothetical protein n=1 Tax=Streptomyces sp. NPDC055105 TaxID=3365719 RepID=UPI0037D961B9